MKNILFICLIFMLCLCGPVYAADVELSRTIKEEYVTAVFDAFTAMADKEIKLSSRELKSVVVFEFQKQQPGESQKKFANRALNSLLFALIDLEAESDYKTRRDAGIESLVVAPKKELPEDAIETFK